MIAFMSDNHIDPDMAAEVFVLEPQAERVEEGSGAGSARLDEQLERGSPTAGTGPEGSTNWKHAVEPAFSEARARTCPLPQSTVKFEPVASRRGVELDEYPADRSSR